VVYLDESGFERTAYRPHGWACRGQRITGERSGQPRPRTSLIAGKWGTRLLAPVLFEGGTNAEWFKLWLEEHLFKELAPHSILIMDNAAFHKTAKTRQLIQEAGHTLLFLPPYSPDFNPIEQDFATLKKRRQYAPPDMPLDEIVRSYGN
jgi:transposase